MPMARKIHLTPEECRARGGEVIIKEGPPTWHGDRIVLCKLPVSRGSDLSLRWQKKPTAYRVIILGKASEFGL